MNRPFKVLLIFLFFFCYYHPSEAQIPASGLVAYYPFNGNANDESGNGNDGTVNGATLTVDRFGKSNSAYNLYGNDLNKITLSPFTPPSIITISLWFNPVDAGPTTGLQGSTLFSNTEKFVNHDQVAVWMSGGVLTFYISNAAGTGYFVASNSYISLNKWHHLVCTIDDQKQLKCILIMNFKLKLQHGVAHI